MYIRFDSVLRTFLIDLFIGKERQRVSMTIDTNMLDILFPTNCCMDKACLQNYGIYFFNQSSSCIVDEVNQVRNQCYNYNCHTIEYSDRVEKRDAEYHYGILKRATVYDYVNLENQANYNTFYPLEIIIDVQTLNEPYIPPTLGLAPSNVFKKKEFTIDIKKNNIDFSLQSGWKHQLLNIPDLLFSYSAYLITKQGDIKTIFDSGMDYIELPSDLYQQIKKYIVSNSNIGINSPLFKNEIIEVRRNERLIGPPLTFSFKTTNGEKWSVTLDITEYVYNVYNDRYEMLIKESMDDKVHMGNIIMRKQKIGFKNGSIFIY